jgi:hypothetical protein
MPETTAPYIGPRPFEQSDRDIFFGRTQEANELVSLITAHSVVLLYAQSGAGKTSLVRAGLIPLLEREESFKVFPPMRVRENIDTPDRPDSIENVYVFNALCSISSPESLNSLSGMSLTDYLKTTKKDSGDGDGSCPTALIFDQFEELFTLYPERWEERRAFFKQIRDALNANPLLRVLFAMREDFIAELDPYVSLLPEKLRTRLRVERLREKTARRAITEPLEKVKTTNHARQFAPGVADKLVNNLLQIQVRTPHGIKTVKGEFVETLQLQVVCQALWEKLGPEDQLITDAHLEEYGNVDKALVVFYENAIEETVKKTRIKEGRLRHWFERTLITPTGTRGTVFRGENETGGIPNNVIDELENHRIIRVELRGQAQWYELTHDRFVETVQTSNQNWLLSRPATEEIRKNLEERAAAWIRNEQQDEDLLDDVDLRQAERWLRSPDAMEIEPSHELRSFIYSSSQLSKRKFKDQMEEISRLQQQAKTASRFRKLTVGIGIVTLACVVALGILYYYYQRTETLRSKNEDLNHTVQQANDTIRSQNAALSRQLLEIQVSEKLSAVSNLLVLGKIDEAEPQLNELFRTYEQKSDRAQSAKILMALADVSYARTQLKLQGYDRAINKYEEVLKALEQVSDSKLRDGLRAQVSMKKGDVYCEWARVEEQAGSKNAPKEYQNSQQSYSDANFWFNSAGNTAGAVEAAKKREDAKTRYNEALFNSSPWQRGINARPQSQR